MVYANHYPIHTVRIDTLSELTVGFLAGGQGLRLGGRDKGLLPIQGRLLIDQLSRALPSWIDSTVISCWRNEHTYKLFSDRLVCDYPLSAGPVAGVLALQSACSSDWLAVIPCDQKRIPQQWIEFWRTTIRETSNGYVATEGGRHTPLILVHRQAFSLAQNYFDRGGRTLIGACDAMQLTRWNCQGSGNDIDDWEDLSA